MTEADELLSLHDDASLDGRDEVTDGIQGLLDRLAKQPESAENAGRVGACLAALLLIDGDMLVLAATERQPWVRSSVAAQFKQLRALFPASARAFDRIRLGQPVERAHFGQGTASLSSLADTPSGRECIAALVDDTWHELRRRIGSPEASGILWCLVALRPLQGVAQREVKDVVRQLRAREYELPAEERKLFIRAIERLGP